MEMETLRDKKEEAASDTELEFLAIFLLKNYLSQIFDEQHCLLTCDL